MAGDQARMEPGTFQETIWLTACGLVSALGVGTPSLLDGVRNDVTGVAKASLPGLPPVHAALVNDEVIAKFDRRLDLRPMDRSSRWATVAARAALREAAFPEKPSTLADLGLYLHLATGPSWAESEYLLSFLRHNHQVNQLVAFPYIVPSSVAGNVCRALRLTGHNLTLSAGPGAGLLGLIPAIATLRAGHTEALLTGAVDELSERILTDRFRAGLLQPDGPPPGEGAAMLLLETARHAQARGAQPLACVVGLACSTEVGQARSADPEDRTLEETVRDALAQAHVNAEDVGVFCASGLPGRMAELIARLCPGWAGRTVGVSRQTGCLEGAQPLIDLAAALLLPSPWLASGGHVLAVSASPQGVNGVVVLRRGP
jgi:3-oxoacyl-[acyl-carrier-protein] synthase II